MDFDTIRNDVYAIDNRALRRRVLRDLEALIEDLFIEEDLHDRAEQMEPLFS